MLSKPTPLALAALVAAALAAPHALAQTAPAAQKQAAVKPSGVQRITLRTGIKDGKMVFLDEKGQANPTLKAKVGDTVEITISSGDGAQHDIVIPELNVKSAQFDASTGPSIVLTCIALFLLSLVGGRFRRESPARRAA